MWTSARSPANFSAAASRRNRGRPCSAIARTTGASRTARFTSGSTSRAGFATPAAPAATCCSWSSSSSSASSPAGSLARMPDSHRQARDFLAARVRLPPLSKLASGSPEEAEEAHRLTLRVREALTAFAEPRITSGSIGNPEVLAWFRGKYGISEETISRLQIGYAENGVAQRGAHLDGRAGRLHHARTGGHLRLPAHRAGRAGPVFRWPDRLPVLEPRARRLHDRTAARPGHRITNGRSRSTRNWRSTTTATTATSSPYIRNDVLYNEDVLLARPERVIITEGVTDCISLMEHGFPVVSPVTVQIREADWERLLPKLAGVKTVYICQDNEISEAGMQGALKTARILAQHGIATRVAVLPLGEKQQAAREKLASSAWRQRRGRRVAGRREDRRQRVLRVRQDGGRFRSDPRGRADPARTGDLETQYRDSGR